MKKLFLALILLGVTIAALLVFLSHPRPAAMKIEHVASIDGDLDEKAEMGALAQLRAYVASVAMAIPSQKAKYRISSSTPQFVLLSFDGSKSLDMLNDTLDFARDMRSRGKLVHFTYFINAAYFLTQENAGVYQAPRQERATSKIGFASTSPDIALRVRGFNRALVDGHEVGSHSVGHFDGSSWSYDEWKQEFDAFTSILSGVQKNNPLQKIDSVDFGATVRGFRAPQLGVNENLYRVLSDSRFSYDASGISANDIWPYKDAHDIWRIPLGILFMGADKKPIASMDYNIWKHQSDAKDLAARGTPLWDSYLKETEDAYMTYFMENYNGNRAPISIADHFSKWNDGVYWEAMKGFAREVCGLPHVRCATFKELVEYLNTTGAPPKL